MSRRLAWILVIREIADALRYQGPLVADLLSFGQELVPLIAEDGTKAAEVLEALVALLESADPARAIQAIQEAPEGAETS